MKKLILKPGAEAFDALTGVTVATFKALNAPGARMVQKKNPFVQLIGAAWLAAFGVLLPLFLLKCIGGLLFAHDPLYAWRR